MKSSRSISVFQSIVRNSFAAVLVLPSFITHARGDASLSLDPNPPKACEVLTVIWSNEESAVVNVAVIEEGDQSATTLFEITVDTPTQPVEWAVGPSAGISLQIAVFAGGDASSLLQATGVAVQSGPCGLSGGEHGAPTTGPFTSSPSPSATQLSSSRPESLGSSTSFARPSTQTAPPGSLSSSMPTVPGIVAQSTTTSLSTVSPDNLSPSVPTVTVTKSVTTSPLTAQSRISMGAVVGVAAGVSAGVVCLALVAFSYIKRRRSHVPTARADPFVAHRRNSNFYVDAPSSNEARDGLPGEPEIYEQGNLRPNSSLGALVSSIESRALDRVPHPCHPRRESIDSCLMSDKLLRDQRNRAAPMSTTGGNSGQAGAAVQLAVSASGRGVEHPRGLQQESDGGVWLAGGRAAEISTDDFGEDNTWDGSALPPPYSSQFGET